MLIRHFRRLFAAMLALALLLGTACAQTQPLNILLIGVDTIREETNGRSDAMILVRADPEGGEARMVSFLRDLYVPIPGVGKTRLNAAYYYGGEQLLKETLQRNFGVEIDRTVTVHFSMLAELVDQLGGVEIDVSPRELAQLNNILNDYNDSYGLSGGQVDQAGLQRLNGKQALCYSRIRKIDSDFQRTSRQQAVIAAMLRQAQTLDRWQLFWLALQNLPKVRTDLSLGDIAQLLPLVTNAQQLELQTARVPFDGAYADETINGMMVLTPNLERNRAKLHAFLNGKE